MARGVEAIGGSVVLSAQSGRMKIIDVLLADGVGAYWYDDQSAIRSGASQDGLLYRGRAVTAGFNAIRMPAKCLSIGLLLEDGHVSWGDAMTVQYAGAGGRESPFDPSVARGTVERELRPSLIGQSVLNFRSSGVGGNAGGPPGLSRALRYGLSQARLDAAAHAAGTTRAEVICRDWALPVMPARVPLFAQSGDDRYVNVDKMILKQVDVLPHGLINSGEKLGPRGETFAAYARWVAERVGQIGAQDYSPTLHFDLYGTAGIEFGGDLEAIGAFLAAVGDSLAPFSVRIESPLPAASRGAQIEGFATLRAILHRLGSEVELVADEWCDTLDDVRAFAREKAAHLVQIKMPDVGPLEDSIDAVLECQKLGTAAYLGGSCAETDGSARAAVHVAIATRPAMLLAKPGMGVDEGLTIVGNEMNRTVAELQARAAG